MRWLIGGVVASLVLAGGVALVEHNSKASNDSSSSVSAIATDIAAHPATPSPQYGARAASSSPAPRPRPALRRTQWSTTAPLPALPTGPLTLAGCPPPARPPGPPGPPPWHPAHLVPDRKLPKVTAPARWTSDLQAIR